MSSQRYPVKPNDPTDIPLYIGEVQEWADIRAERWPLAAPPPAIQAAEFNTVFDELMRWALPLEADLESHVLRTSSDQFCEFVLLIKRIKRQRALRTHRPPRYIMSLEIMRPMLFHVQRVHNEMNIARGVAAKGVQRTQVTKQRNAKSDIKSSDAK
ncbi:hypothetical protein AcW2_005221 [Taiwanofungus camphoratus]|nr:hypothetical protein AcW2_005221 [Antrodia cinnamomea]